MLHGSDGIRTATRPMTLYGHPFGMFADFLDKRAVWYFRQKDKRT